MNSAYDLRGFGCHAMPTLVVGMFRHNSVSLKIHWLNLPTNAACGRGVIGRSNHKCTAVIAAEGICFKFSSSAENSSARMKKDMAPRTTARQQSRHRNFAPFHHKGIQPRRPYLDMQSPLPGRRDGCAPLVAPTRQARADRRFRQAELAALSIHKHAAMSKNRLQILFSPRPARRNHRLAERTD